MSLASTRARLTGLTRQLAVEWAETRGHWQDDKGREFERIYVEELFAHVERTTAMMDSLEQVLNKIRRDCE